ncbi:hypothetical protein BDP27DRAFT_1320524 [Rhodocollybia butyracea]|uniref:Uncharacterized protein n=1 Tax=Rhodocollybia butyracea TaxID=206335 RepID=A0A9P5Q1N9_9AGAR|nr:hypothetical protein BDP27DRAFT_1320524 [Rhodocollybia butyracea]
MSKVEEAEKFVAGHNSAKSNYWANLDLTSFRSVSAFYTQTRTDGNLRTLQVNYLSNVLLCILLLPNLVKASAPSAPSRLVLVSSDVHYSLRKEYCTASVMRQRTILSKSSRLLPEVNIVISSVNPGFCYSKLTRETEAHFPGNIWVPLLKAAVARPAEVGGSVLVRATLMLGAHTGDGGLAEWHGRYLSSCLGVAEESDLLLGDSGEAFSRKLWDDTEILQLYTVYG